MELATLLSNVHGFLSLPEAELLYRLASQVSSDGNIVEIGSYQGRSTIALALGAKVNAATVWSIDPHGSYEVDGVTFGMADNQAYYANIAKYGVGDVVKTINLTSLFIGGIWHLPIDILFIDGNHNYAAVKQDWYDYSPHV